MNKNLLELLDLLSKIPKSEIQKLRNTLVHEGIPSFTSKKISLAIEPTRIQVTTTQLRDFFYNQALNCGMNSVTVEWLMGHDIGIAKRYLTDNIKQVYSKFEQAVSFSSI